MSNLNANRIRARCSIFSVDFVVELIIVIMIIGILVYIAIPISQLRDDKITVLQVMDKVQPLRMKVERHILATGSIPELPSDVPDSAPVNAHKMATAQLENNGVVVVRFDQSIEGRLAGLTIEVSPIIENNTLFWRCDQGTLPQTYRSSSCWDYSHPDSNLWRSKKDYRALSYFDIAQLDKVYQTMREVKSLHMQVQEHILKTSCIPGLASDIPGVAPVRVQDTAIGQLENNGVIVVRFDQSLDRSIAGTSIELTPVIEGNVLSWQCDHGTLPQKYRSSSCWIY